MLSHSRNWPRPSLCARATSFLEGDDVITTNNNAAPAVWKRAWPIVGLAVAILVNMLWVGVIGYERQAL